MGKSDNLDGKRFGKLEVVELSHKRENRRYWKCRCDCGNTVIREAQSLIYGGSKSCGCLRNEKTSKRSLKDLTGKKFGMLTVLRRTDNVGKNTMWLCICDCGKETVTCGGRLVNGTTRSCGCLKHLSYGITHGKSDTRLYHIWSSMKSRCLTETCHAYELYGGRGITVCDEWLHDFQIFYDWAMANGYAEDLTIDRIDVNGNYEPSNCRWADWSTQGYNKRNTIYITYSGKRKPLNYWSEITGIKKQTLCNRKYLGWSDKECIETPVGKRIHPSKG